MSDIPQPPNPPPHYQPQYSVAPTKDQNTVGLVGFILSLCGFAFALLFPVGFIVSLCGIRREPKGFAIAGAIIGGLGSMFIMLIIVLYGVLIAAVLGACIGIGTLGQPYIETAQVLRQAESRIDDAVVATQGVPDDLDGNALLGDLQDGWGTTLRYQQTDDSFLIQSAGPDTVFDTSDDIDHDDPDTQIFNLEGIESTESDAATSSEIEIEIVESDADVDPDKDESDAGRDLKTPSSDKKKASPDADEKEPSSQNQ